MIIGRNTLVTDLKVQSGVTMGNVYIKPTLTLTLTLALINPDSSSPKILQHMLWMTGHLMVDFMLSVNVIIGKNILVQLVWCHSQSA